MASFYFSLILYFVIVVIASYYRCLAWRIAIAVAVNCAGTRVFFTSRKERNKQA